MRQPPGVADSNDPRALEYFHRDLYDQHRLRGTRTFDLPNLTAGAQTTFTITVNGAKANQQQTVEYGLPATWNTSLVVGAAFVSADDTVTLAIYNPTGGAIDMGSATYSVRVRP
ncbi:MAG: hypothetical protein OEW25_01980 [Nitrospira sp.]|nr:hypothetical protein [Nitrospira sp.]MDH4327380.1 hypothetical protein [Nitrospira sp.]MDH5252067.1 hypothetical protein [Nitrospira sp.]